MSLGFVYIAYAIDDALAAAAVADGIRDAGWNVCFGHLAEPGADDFATNQERLAEAICAVVVWSSNAANSSHVKGDASEAARRNKLILVALDDAAPPDPWLIAARLSDSAEVFDLNAASAVLLRIRNHAAPIWKAPGRNGRGRIIPYIAPDQRGRLPRLAVAFGGIIATLVAAAAVWVVVQPMVDQGSVAAALAQTSTPNLVGGTMTEDASEASRKWLRVSKSDLPAIRRFMRDYDGTQPAEAARRRIQVLEEVAWRGVLKADDLASQLESLISFRMDFPDGVHSSEALLVENTRRTTLDQIRDDLTLLGYMRPGSPDVSAVRAGVEAYERSIGSLPSGRITERLSRSLSAIAPTSPVEPAL